MLLWVTFKFLHKLSQISFWPYHILFSPIQAFNPTQSNLEMEHRILLPALRFDLNFLHYFLPHLQLFSSFTFLPVQSEPFPLCSSRPLHSAVVSFPFNFHQVPLFLSWFCQVLLFTMKENFIFPLSSPYFNSLENSKISKTRNKMI